VEAPARSGSGRTQKPFAFLALGVRIPPAGEIGGEARNLIEPGAFGKDAANHSRELSNLDMLETKLAGEPSRGILAGRRSESLFRDGWKNLFFFGPGVAPKNVVERLAGGAGGSGIARSHRGEEQTEEIIQPAMLRRQTLEESRRSHSILFVPHGRPRTGSRISASGSPAANPKRAATVLAIETGETLGA